MSVIVTCNCGKRFRAKDEHAGRSGRCPSCGRAVLIPGVPAGAAVSAAPAMSSVASPTPPAPPPCVNMPAMPAPPAVRTAPSVLCPKIYTDYGVPYCQLTRFAARQKGLRYFKERWVSLEEYAVLKKENAVIAWIRNLRDLSMIATAAVLIVGLLVILVSAQLPGPDASNMVAIFLVALIVSGGTAALWFFAMQWNQVCRWILVGLNVVSMLLQLIGMCVEASTSMFPGLVVLPALFGLLIQGLIVWLLACPTASRLFLYNETH